MQESRAFAPLDALEHALRARVRRAATVSALSAPNARRGASVVFDAGPLGAFTVVFGPAGTSLVPGKKRGASATLAGDPADLVAIAEGRLPGIEAFLTGRLFVRGNLALPLELDELVPPEHGDPRTPKCRFAHALGVRSFYLDAGPRDAPALVLVHGLGATSASFLPTLWEFAKTHRVIAVDLPGFGESEKPIRPLHAAFFARWLVALLDSLGIARATFVGNSMGGRVSLEVALRSPDRAERLVLLAPSLAFLRYRFAVRVVRLLRPELAALPIPVLHAIVRRVLRTLFAKPDRVAPGAMAGAADEFLRVFRTRRGRIAFFHAAREIYLEEPYGPKGFWERLTTLSTPSLFVFGSHDFLVPHAFRRHVERAVPAATCVTFDDCGHVPQFELPAETHAAMRDFLGR